MPGLHKAVAAGLASLALAVPAPAMAAPEMSLPNMPALEAPAVPGVDLPELSGVAQYNTALGALPVAPPIAGSAAYEATLTAPVAPAVTGQQATCRRLRRLFCRVSSRLLRRQVTCFRGCPVRRSAGRFADGAAYCRPRRL